MQAVLTSTNATHPARSGNLSCCCGKMALTVPVADAALARFSRVGRLPRAGAVRQVAETDGWQVMNLDDLAEQAAPHLATLVHPGDDDTPAFPINLPMFQPAVLPEGMASEEAEELGLPSSDFGKLFLQAEFAMLQEQFNVAFIDADELADLRAAAAVREPKRNEVKRFYTSCRDEPIFRVMVKGFDTDHPEIPCEAIKALQGRHQCPHSSA